MRLSRNRTFVLREPQDERASTQFCTSPIPFVVRLSNHERNCDTVSVAGRPCPTPRCFDDYPSSEELSRSAGALGTGGDKPLLRAGLLIYIRPCFERSAAMERLERLEPGIR